MRGEALIVGLGESGLSVARALAARGIGFVAADSRAAPPGLDVFRNTYPRVPVHLGPFDAELFRRMPSLVLSPGVAPGDPAVRAARSAGAEVLGDIELFARLARAPVVAITGSNGKSTVTSLLGAMCRAAGLRVGVGGNLGPPALDLLGDATELYVLELSSFQLETTTSLNARVGCLLNISPDHLDRHADLDAYIAAKQRVFRGDGTLVINADDPRVAAMAGGVAADRRILRFTLDLPGPEDFGRIEQAGRVWLGRGDEPWLATDELPLSGAPNQANVLAALAMGSALGLPRPAMLAALREFRGLPHRCEFVTERASVRWYDDSKGTNVGATVAAVQGLPGPLVLIAGGLGKGQDFAPLAAALDGRVRALVLIGRDAPLIAATVGDDVLVRRAADMSEAVALAAALAEPGDRVLLSPACASQDMFTDYRARGRAFADAVRALP